MYEKTIYKYMEFTLHPKENVTSTIHRIKAKGFNILRVEFA